MKKLLIVCSLLAAGAIPPVASAINTNHADQANAQTECRADLMSMGRDNFDALWGTNVTDKPDSPGFKRNAFGKCVSKRARDEALERRLSRINAVRECRQELQADQTLFLATYGAQTSTVPSPGQGPGNGGQGQGTPQNGQNQGQSEIHKALITCIRTLTRKNKAGFEEQDQLVVAALRECRLEELDSTLFHAKHDSDIPSAIGTDFAGYFGTNTNDSNAFSRCVSLTLADLKQAQTQSQT